MAWRGAGVKVVHASPARGSLGRPAAGHTAAVTERDAALGWRKYSDRDDATTRCAEIAAKAVE